MVARIDGLIERLALRLALKPAQPHIHRIIGFTAEAAGDHHALGDLERDDLLLHDLEPFLHLAGAGPCIGATRRTPSPPLLSLIPSGVGDLRSGIGDVQIPVVGAALAKPARAPYLLPA